MYYFAYCTWLDEEHMRAVAPEAELVEHGSLPNHAVEFRAAEGRLGGSCHISNSVEAYGKEARGVIFQVDDRHFRTEYAGSRVAFYTVTGESGRGYECFTYILSEPREIDTPRPEYWRHIDDGARRWGLPSAYVSELAARHGVVREARGGGEEARP